MAKSSDIFEADKISLYSYLRKKVTFIRGQQRPVPASDSITKNPPMKVSFDGVVGPVGFEPTTYGL